MSADDATRPNDTSIGFDRAWLELRRPFDDAALSAAPIRALQDHIAQHNPRAPVRVLDLGTGTGAALARLGSWIPNHLVDAYAVDLDRALLDTPEPLRKNVARTVVHADAMGPLAAHGGPLDGWADLVISHAFADLVPLASLASRVGALLRPGGVAHIALVYDGVTTFHPALRDDSEQPLLSAYHEHMVRFGGDGAAAGGQMETTLQDAGLALRSRGESWWRVSSGPTADRSAMLLERMVDFVARAARQRNLDPGTVDAWTGIRRRQIMDGSLSLAVRHVDFLAARPIAPA